VSNAGVGQIAVPEGYTNTAGFVDPDGRVGVVASKFNAEVVGKLLEGALAKLDEHGVGPDRVTVALVPGAFELPLACRRLAQTDGVVAVVALGCVVRGGTPHFEYVCSEASRGIMQVMLDTGVPVGFGLLTTDDQKQARARAGGADGNKGADAAEAALEMAGLLQALTPTPTA
jgi:6,7-dimethyl-8-ribityllumazine synthase